MNYKLQVKETGKKSAKFHYQVIDQNGKVISERNSNREYVACTIDGSFFFGRIDLIGKGDHGRLTKWSIERMNMSEAEFIKRFPSDIYTYRYDEFIEEGKQDFQRFSSIAYK